MRLIDLEEPRFCRNTYFVSLNDLCFEVVQFVVHFLKIDSINHCQRVRFCIKMYWKPVSNIQVSGIGNDTVPHQTLSHRCIYDCRYDTPVHNPIVPFVPITARE